jgi:hypothetical protein
MALCCTATRKTIQSCPCLLAMVILLLMTILSRGSCGAANNRYTPSRPSQRGRRSSFHTIFELVDVHETCRSVHAVRPQITARQSTRV